MSTCDTSETLNALPTVAEQEQEHPPLQPSVAGFHRAGNVADEMLHNLRRSAGRSASTAISLTVASASERSHEELLPRFVRATQILMLGAERRRAAEAESEVK